MLKLSGRRFIALALSLILFAAVFVWDIPSSRAEEPPAQSTVPAESAEPEPTETPIETPLPTEEPAAAETPTPSDIALPEISENIPELPSYNQPPDSATEPAEQIEPCATSGDYDYADNGDGTVTITGYHGAGGDITIPSTLDGKTVTIIGYTAFQNNKSINRLTIPNGVKKIEGYSFYSSNITQVSIPSTVTVIEQFAFFWCAKLESINVDPSNTMYASQDGVLFNKAMTTLLCYPDGNPRTDYSVPSGIITIDTGAFDNCNFLKNISLSDGVTIISPVAFSSCTGLQTIELPVSLEYIWGSAFSQCSSLGSVFIPKNVRHIDNSIFWECTSLESIEVDPANTYFKSEDGVLFNKDQTTLYCCPAKKTGICNIPNTVTTIKTQAFYHCANLSDINLSANVSTIEREAFTGCSGIQEIELPEGVTRIENGTFGRCIQLRHISIPSTLTFIGSWAFSNCSSLEQIVIPDSVTTIGNSAFFGCSKITELIFPADVTAFEISVVAGCSSLQTFSIPDGIETICDSAFRDCSSLKSVIIPDSVRSIGEQAFMNCVSLQQIDIPSQVESIGRQAFMNCEKIRNVTLPDSLSVIEAYLFYNCIALETTAIPNGFTQINESAFAKCSSLKQIILPDSVTNIQEDVFSECSELYSVTLPAALETIEQSLFYQCSKLESINIPNSIKAIGAFAFFHCDSLINIKLPYGLDSIGESAFGNCGKLNSIVLPDSISSIGQSAFKECKCLTDIKIPKNLKSIEAEVFYSCTDLRNVTFQEGISSIGNFAFTFCNVQKLVIPEGAKRIGWNAFSGCDNLETISFPASITSIDEEAFGNCSKLYSAFFNGNAPSLGRAVFVNCAYYFTVFYKMANSGFSNTWYGYPTSTKNPSAVYTLKFDTQDGNVYKYTGVYNMLISPSIPPKDHYTFDGWYPTPECNTAPITIPYKITDNQTLYAKWWGHPCLVSYFASGVQMPTVWYEYGDVITSPPIANVAGYYFAGWYPTRECNTAPVEFPYTLTINHTYFYAKMVPIGSYLAGITITAGSLSSPFSSLLRNYKITLGENEPSVTLAPDKLDGVSMTINGKAVSSTTVSLASGKSKTVTIKVKYGKKSNTYKFTVTRAKSGDNNLASLTNTAGVLSQPFDPNVTNYTLNLDENTSSVTLKAAKSNVMAKVSPASKKLTLKNGQTKVLKFTVKAQSGAKKTYTVTVTRAPSTNTNLKMLKTSVPLSPGFSAAATDYIVTLPADKGTVTISAKAFDKLSKVTINGTKKASQKITMANGQSTMVSVVVTSQAGTTKEYRVLVQRP